MMETNDVLHLGQNNLKEQFYDSLYFLVQGHTLIKQMCQHFKKIVYEERVFLHRQLIIRD